MKAVITVVGLAVAASASMADVYTDSASFLADLQPGYFFNGFADSGSGPVASLSYDNGTYAYTVTAAGPVNGGLYNEPGIISTNNATDHILINFTSGNVTAVGGNFWGTDINVIPFAVNVNIALSDGTNVTFNTTSASAFRGFTSSSVITSMTIDALEALPDNPPFAWATMDNLYVGAAVPAPGAMALLGLGGLAATRRRR